MPMTKALALFLTLLTSLSAQDFDPFSLPSARDAPEKIESSVNLVSGASTIAPGETFSIALQLSHPEGWHSYYVNTGLIGEVLSVDWTLPEGFSAEYQGWPTPHLSESFGYKTIGYEGTVIHLYTVTPPENLTEGEEYQLAVEATWQICNDTGCIPEKFTGSMTLPAAEKSLPNAQVADLFQEARSHYPKSGDNLTVEASEKNQVITLEVKPVGTLSPDAVKFFDADGQVSVQEPHPATVSGKTLTIELPRNLGTDLSDPGPVKDRLKGILTDGQESFQIDVAIGEPAETAESGSLSGILPILGGMFLGGLILNLMPCVFPVIGIKIMGFVEQSGHDRKKVILHGLMFAAGVFASFWILALLILAGGIRNWGGQLENPYVILTLIIVMLLLAMNMYGVFEIGVGATGVGSNLTHKEGLSGSFFSGILATVVATPCSAPFLGAALGAAVALPTFWFFLAFTFMAAGLALPYLTLSAFPNLVRKLPRPGPWMESFKQAMSFLLFATVGYLLWVYSDQVFQQDYGLKGLFVMIGLSCIAAAGWVWGRWTTPSKKPKTKWIARAITLLLFATGIILAKPSPPENIPESAQIDWQTWSKEKEEELRAEGVPVYIDFTAKWCVTCQVNKKNAYSEEVVELMKAKKVVFLKADKTTSNPEIDAELTRLGRSAIPVNVLYAPGESEPHITPEVLTPSFMMNFVTKWLGESSAEEG
jgi:thiol:disulfide interchange protein DsbD